MIKGEARLRFTVRIVCAKFYHVSSYSFGHNRGNSMNFSLFSRFNPTCQRPPIPSLKNPRTKLQFPKTYSKPFIHCDPSLYFTFPALLPLFFYFSLVLFVTNEGPRPPKCNHHRHHHLLASTSTHSSLSKKFSLSPQP